MSTSGILGLLFEINADPWKVQQALQAVEASMQNAGTRPEGGVGPDSRSLSDVVLRMVQIDQVLDEPTAPANKLTQSMLRGFEATQNSSQAHQSAARAVKDHQNAITALAEHIPMLSKRVHAELIPSLTELGSSAANTSRRLGDQLATSFQLSGEAAKTFGDTVSRALTRATEASNGAVAAEGARLTATLGFRRVAAGIEAVWETAKGIASLAEWDFRGAALHFMSAAEYGIIAGTGARHAHGAGARGGYGYGGREPHFGPEGGGRGESRIRPGEGAGGTTVVFNVSGHLITGPETAEWMAGQLTQFVRERDGELMSSRTKDSTLSRDSLNG